MRNPDYFRVGVAAIALAVITPIYWILEFSYQGFDTATRIPSFDILSVLFLVTGILSIPVIPQNADFRVSETIQFKAHE